MRWQVPVWRPGQEAGFVEYEIPSGQSVVRLRLQQGSHQVEIGYDEIEVPDGARTVLADLETEPDSEIEEDAVEESEFAEVAEDSAESPEKEEPNTDEDKKAKSFLDALNSIGGSNKRKHRARRRRTKGGS